MDGRHLFLLTLVILPMLYCSSDEEYILQQEFERALNTTSNIYTLQKNFQPDSDASVVCIPVDYNVTCKDPCLNQSSTINCTGSGYQVSYLWTSFDTKTIPGDLLLHWAISGVRILGFEWADKCSHSSKNAIALNLNVNTLPCVSDPESAIAALESVTKEVSLVPFIVWFEVWRSRVELMRSLDSSIYKLILAVLMECFRTVLVEH